ncbi:DinB family protein [soil metagenome]
MPIIPDTKDWTWVLEAPCSECGFDAARFDERDVADLIRANAAVWPAILSAPDVRLRPDESTWSPLEYGAHVRDVFRLGSVRFDLMLTQDDPLFANWDQDETAIVERYGEQDPIVVAGELVAAANALADTLDAVPADAWQRPGRRGDGAGFTVASFAKYVIHDPVHHRWDASGVRFDA